MSSKSSELHVANIRTMRFISLLSRTPPLSTSSSVACLSVTGFRLHDERNYVKAARAKIAWPREDASAYRCGQMKWQICLTKTVAGW
jgi:hypothetical protein